MSDWLDQHLEEFVRPALGTVPSLTSETSVNFAKWFPYRHFNAMRACWKVAKKRAHGRPILLAGRDVWAFECLAQLEGFRGTICRPDISSPVAEHVVESYQHCYLIDTGYLGSIPKKLKIVDFGLLTYRMTTTGYYKDGRLTDQAKWYKDLGRHQLFPYAKRGPITCLAYNLEGSPKYWTRGRMAGKKISQSHSEINEFTRAAHFTLYIASMMPRIRRRAPYVFSVGRGI